MIHELTHNQLRLGDLLIERRLITSQQLQVAIEVQSHLSKQRALGQVLIDLDFITTNDLRSILQRQSWMRRAAKVIAFCTIGTMGLTTTACSTDAAEKTHKVETPKPDKPKDPDDPSEPDDPDDPSEPELPVLLEGPTSQVSYEGLSVTFAVKAERYTRIAWFKDGVLISGQEQTQLVVNPVGLDSAGQYGCRLYNDDKTVSCEPFHLEVKAKVKLISQPLNQQAQVGQNITFAVIATGAGPINYIWYKNNEMLVAGNNLAQLQLNNVQLEDHGDYRVEVSNAGTQVLSSTAKLAVEEPLLARVELNWQMPNQREDGSQLSSDDIDGYEVYMAANSGEYEKVKTVENAFVLDTVIADLNAGYYQFVIRTRDSQGLLSEPSESVDIRI